jgi:hypothetical protein
MRRPGSILEEIAFFGGDVAFGCRGSSILRTLGSAASPLRWCFLRISILVLLLNRSAIYGLIVLFKNFLRKSVLALPVFLVFSF